MLINTKGEKKQAGVMRQEVIDIFPRFKSVCKSQPTEPSHTAHRRSSLRALRLRNNKTISVGE